LDRVGLGALCVESVGCHVSRHIFLHKRQRAEPSISSTTTINSQQPSTLITIDQTSSDPRITTNITTVTTTMDHEVIITENARPVCHKPLPPLDPILSPTATGSILLFYQYIEPEWTKSQHKTSLKKVIEIATKFNITGRGRVAREGLNCTLTGKPSDIRSFCYALRDWDKNFKETDFKITDGVNLDKMFKSLSIRKTNELVAYGLVGGECFFLCSCIGLFNWYDVKELP
jgi:hypothetical protein